MRSVEDQQARVAAAAVAPRPVRVAIAEAQGLMCAEEVVTERPLPGFDQAAIDGYAVRSVDVMGADSGGDADVTLPVVSTIAAGERTPTRLQPRQAARVQTGAPMPTLADAVLPLRWTDGGESRVRVLRGVRSGAYVRRTGDDVQPGDVAVRAGTIILGISIVLENLALIFFKSDTRTIETAYTLTTVPLNIGVAQAMIALPKLVAFGGALVASALLMLVVNRTDLGRAIRAVAKEKHGARLMGIDVDHVYAMSFGIGLACLGAAACLLLPAYYVNPQVGSGFVLVAFTIVVLGGMGSFAGALVGGLLIGAIPLILNRKRVMAGA